MGLVVGTPDRDFFEQNPELEYISEVKSIIKKYGSKKKASPILWAVYLTEDPNSKLYRGMDLEERRAEVAKNYLNNPDFDWGELNEFIRTYPRIALTKEEIFFDIWARKLDEIQAYFKEVNLMDFDEVEKVLKAMNQVPKLLEGYEAMKNKMIASKKTVKTFGGKKESATESGAI